MYGVDTFTAVNLLAFSRWSGRVEPAIPFRISRWIFAICILVSFALLIYRWILAIRAMRSGSITRSYLDPLAVRVQSFRIIGKNGRGWKRFLVFAELTKSKKGAEYVALYTYFAFQCKSPDLVGVLIYLLIMATSLDEHGLCGRASPSHQCHHAVLCHESGSSSRRRKRPP